MVQDKTAVGQNSCNCLEDSRLNPTANMYLCLPSVYTSCLEDMDMKFLFQKGHTHSEETKKKISESQKGKILSEDHRKKLSESHKGHVVSEETKAKMSAVRKGRRPSENTILGCKLYRTGRPLSEETKQKLRDTHPKGERNRLYGKARSEDVKKKISDANKGENHGMWKGGMSFLPYCHKFNKELKEKIRIRDDRTCQLCGVKENGRRLSVHHVHYDKENCAPDLIALCCECNTKVNVNREHWEEYFVNLLRNRRLLL